MQTRLNRLFGAQLVRYFGASIGALFVDMGSFLVLLESHVPPGPAAAAAYSAGIVAHWVISTRMVFAADVACRGQGRARQKGLFVLSALAGLALTTAIVTSFSLWGADPRIAKALAVCASFGLTWILRRKFVFSAGAAT